MCRLTGRSLAKAKKWSYIGLAVGAVIGFAVIAIVFLTGPKDGGDDCGEQHESQSVTE